MTSRPGSTNVPAARSGPRGNRRRAGAALIALLAVLGGAVVSTATAAQEDNTAGDSTTVRIVARKLDDGRIEFGLQQRQPDNTWGDRQLPRVRFFPTTATVNRWLASSSLDLPAGEVRIVARKLDSGRIEFGLQQQQPDDTWGDRQLPRVRFFPTTATANRWLASSPLTLTTPQPAPQPGGEPTGQFSAVTASYQHSCGLRTDGTITCWGGENFYGEATAPAGQFSAVTAGGSHSCGLRTDGTITCWGNNYDRAERPRRPGSSPPSPPARGRIRAGCAPTAPSPAGAPTTTGTGQATAPAGQYSAVSAGDSFIRAGCAPTAPSPAGAPTRPRPGSGQADAPAGQFSAVSAGSAFVRAAHRRHHHLLGRHSTGATTSGGRPRRPGSTPPSPPARGIRAGCAPTAPSPAGAWTTEEGLTVPRRPGSSPPSPPARG